MNIASYKEEKIKDFSTRVFGMSGDKKDDLSLSEEQEQQPLRIDEASDEGDPMSRPSAVIDDEDDETWTNQPAAAQKNAEPGELADDRDGEAEEEEIEQARAPRRAIQNGKDVLCEELPDRAQRAAGRLKPFLSGIIVVELAGAPERFVFDWRDESPKTVVITKDVQISLDDQGATSIASERVVADTVISLSESHLMAIRSGDLNPQVGMLTDKIRVRGRVGPAVYLFNLVAPRART